MIARSVSLTEAKAKLSELLDLVERGEEMRAPIATLDARMAEAARELGLRAVPGQ